MTAYIAAYDTEFTECPAACRRIVEVHRRLEMPATFFVVGTLLESHGAELRELLDDPLFEVASHTYSHRLMKDHPVCGPRASDEEVRQDIALGKEWVERVFDRPCVGLRTGCGFPDGLCGAPAALGALADAGLGYVSSLLWGPDCSMPALLEQPRTYADDGLPDLWELPGHGWHDNLLKDHNGMGPARLTLWPPAMPEAVPPGFLRTPEEEFAVNGVFLERAARDALTFVSLVWHPWSLARMDPEMHMLKLTLGRVRELGLAPTTYAGLHESVSAAR